VSKRGNAGVVGALGGFRPRQDALLPLESVDYMGDRPRDLFLVLRDLSSDQRELLGANRRDAAPSHQWSKELPAKACKAVRESLERSCKTRGGT
jgi:hypothetical protein